MSFGERLRQARIGLRLTQKELAEKLGISSAAIANYETEVSSPKEDILLKMFDVLNVEPNFLFQDSVSSKTNNSFALSSKEVDFINTYRSLPDEFKDIVLNTMNSLTKYERKTRLRYSLNSANNYKVSYFPEPVSAGTGQYLDYTSLQTMTINTTPPIGADFILRVIGDSMEPEYPDGGLVFVRIQKTIEIGEIGIFFSEGNVFMKVRGENSLESLNKKYPDIKGDKDTKCIGKVIGKLSWSNVVE